MTSLMKISPNPPTSVKMPKYKNRTVSKTANTIKPKSEDKAETTTYTSWVRHHYPKVTKPNMANGHHLENRYDVITRRR